MNCLPPLSMLVLTFLNKWRVLLSQGINILRIHTLYPSQELKTAFCQLYNLQKKIGSNFIITMATIAKKGFLPKEMYIFVAQKKCIVALCAFIGNCDHIRVELNFLRLALYARSVAMSSDKYIAGIYPTLLPKPEESELEFIARTLNTICRASKQPKVLLLNELIPVCVDSTGGSF